MHGTMQTDAHRASVSVVGTTMRTLRATSSVIASPAFSQSLLGNTRNERALNTER